MYRQILPLVAGVVGVSAVSIPIDVGMDGSLKFQPDQVLAKVGDTLEFHFFSGSGGHSVVSSSFSTPCVPGANAFFSGYIPGDDTGSSTFITTVNSTDPIFFYCSLGQHCQSGMVGVVNPAQDQSLAAYQSAAQSVTKASAPTELQGGVLTSENAVAATSGGSSSGAAGGSATMSSGSSMAMTSGGSSTTSAKTTPTTGSGTGTAATASPTKSVGSRKDELSVVLGLAVILGGLVALMA